MKKALSLAFDIIIIINYYFSYCNYHTLWWWICIVVVYIVYWASTYYDIFYMCQWIFLASLISPHNTSFVFAIVLYIRSSSLIILLDLKTFHQDYQFLFFPRWVHFMLAPRAILYPFLIVPRLMLSSYWRPAVRESIQGPFNDLSPLNFELLWIPASICHFFHKGSIIMWSHRAWPTMHAPLPGSEGRSWMAALTSCCQSFSLQKEKLLAPLE